jgi:hypothetical protein
MLATWWAPQRAMARAHIRDDAPETGVDRRFTVGGDRVVERASSSALKASDASVDSVHLDMVFWTWSFDAHRAIPIGYDVEMTPRAWSL